MSRYFTKFAAALLVMLGFAGVSHAQSNENDIIRPITKQGSAAFMFTLQGLGTFGIGSPGAAGFPAGVGAKWYLADDIALRVLLGYASSQTPRTGVGVDTTKTLTASNFGVGVGVEYHFRPLYSTSPYVGAQLGYASGSQDFVDPSNAANVVSAKSNTISFNLLAGFDWFFTRGLAVGAEAGLGWKSEGGTNASGADITTRTGLSLGTDGNVHLVVYF